MPAEPKAWRRNARPRPAGFQDSRQCRSSHIAEARLHKALLEAELYRNRYTHTSKNDEDLPVVR
jgi:hypothetical protein